MNIAYCINVSDPGLPVDQVSVVVVVVVVRRVREKRSIANDIDSDR